MLASKEPVVNGHQLAGKKFEPPTVVSNTQSQKIFPPIMIMVTKSTTSMPLTKYELINGTQIF